MKVDDNAVGKGACNGKFIWMEGKPTTGGEGWAEFVINIPNQENMLLGSCPSLGWQQRLFLGHLATGCPQRKCSGNSKHQVPLGSSTRTNLALGPNQCLARW